MSFRRALSRNRQRPWALTASHSTEPDVGLNKENIVKITVHIFWAKLWDSRHIQWSAYTGLGEESDAQVQKMEIGRPGSLHVFCSLLVFFLTLDFRFMCPWPTVQSSAKPSRPTLRKDPMSWQHSTPEQVDK